MVPAAVLDIKAYVSDPEGNGVEVTDPKTLEKIKRVALELARDEAIQDTEEIEYGEYM
jgi:catechol-2,3-dioxygenase